MVIDKKKIQLIKQNKSPISDTEIEEFLDNGKLNLTAILDKETAYREACFVIVATPIDYKLETNSFNTHQ